MYNCILLLHCVCRLVSSIYNTMELQLLCYARACRNYVSLYLARPFTIKLLKLGYLATKLKSSLQKFYGRHHNLMDSYVVSICTIKTDLFIVSQFSFPLSPTLDLTFYEKILENQRALTLPVHPVHAPSIQLSHSCSFTFFFTLFCFCYLMFFVVCVRFLMSALFTGLHACDFCQNLGFLYYSLRFLFLCTWILIYPKCPTFDASVIFADIYLEHQSFWLLGIFLLASASNCREVKDTT